MFSKLLQSIRLTVVLFEFTLLLTCVFGEEKSISSSATMYKPASASSVIDRNFYRQNWCSSYGSLGGSEVVINLGSELKVHTVYIQQDHYNGYQHYLGDSKIYVANLIDLYSVVAAKSNVNASGFHALDIVTLGQYLSIRRLDNVCQSNTCGQFYMNEILIYQVPNIISFGATVVLEAPTPSDTYLSVDNLLNHLDHRSSNSFQTIYTDGVGTIANFSSCFRTTNAQIPGHKYVLALDHGESYFQHAILLVQDMFNNSPSLISSNKWFQNFRIIIGNNIDYNLNTECATSPFMTNDAGINSGSDGSGWKFGTEVWCNLEGRYTHIVIDDLSPALISLYYEMTICGLGIMGTKYVRITDPITEIIIIKGDIFSFDVAYIYSAVSIGTDLTINLRQAIIIHSFVTLTENLGSSLTQVTIDTSSLLFVSELYDLTLESVNTGQILPYAALKTDVVKVYVTTYIRDNLLESVYTIRQDVPITFEVQKIYSEIPLPQTLAINLRQTSGSELSFVTFDQTFDPAIVTIDATATAVGVYYLYLESFNTLDLLEPTLRTDMIQIEVTNYIRDVPLETPVTITLGDTLIIEVPHTYSEITITPSLDINLMQPSDGTQLSFVYFNEDAADHTKVIIDTSGASFHGIYPLNLYSFSLLNSLEVLKEDTIFVEITSYIRDNPLVEAVSVKKDDLLVIIVPNVYSSITITPIQEINLRQLPGDQELVFVSITEYSGSSNVNVDATGLEAHSTHVLYLESYDVLSGDEAMLRTDIIEILIEPKACDIVQEDLDAFASAYATHYVLFAQLGIGWEQMYYDVLYDTAFYDFFGLDEPDRESCGLLTTELVSGYPFLADFPTLNLFVLQPDWTDEEGTFEDAYQTWTLNGLSCSLPISATVWDCDLVSVGFKKPTILIEYEIGSGPLEKSLPEVEQKPECGLSFTEFYLGSVVASISSASGAVVFENGKFTISSNDYTLDTHTVRLNVIIDTTIIVTDPLIFDIEFVTPPPQFNRAGFSVIAISCSAEDSTWTLELPGLVNPSIQVVTIQMTTASGVFTFAPGINTVSIQGSIRSSLLSGQFCPSESEISLDFLLTSDVLGEAIETITVPITGKASEGKTFAGYIIGSENSASQGGKNAIKIQKLMLDKILMSQTGKLVLKFNKKILVPQIKITGFSIAEVEGNSDENADKEKRFLKYVLQDIEEVLQVRVLDDDQDDELDKSIAKLTLDAMDEDSMTLTVIFSQLDAISAHISEPDMLSVKFLKPGLFVDAETLNPLDKSSYVSEVELKPQVSKSEFEEIKEMAATAAAVGMFATIFELAMCFVLGKALEAMWTLIYAMQFLVYIGMWQIAYPRRMQLFFEELKRVALGEFLDDLGLEEKVLTFVGVDEDEEDGDDSDDKVGYERFGSPDLFQSFGLTFYLTMGIFFFILLIALLIIFIGRRSKLSEKNELRLSKLEDQLFYNPVIRITFLSGIKNNIVSAMVFKLLPHDRNQMIGAVLIFAITNLIPLLYARVLYKHRLELDTEEQTRRIGSLYDNKNVRSDRNHRVWVFPLSFFYRRTGFALITIYLFEMPDMQMIAHQFLSMVTIVYLSWDSEKYTERSIRYIEISTEVLLLFSCMLIQQIILPLSDVQLSDLTIMIFVTLGLLIVFNIGFVIYNVVENCKDKKRLKSREVRRVIWEAAWKEAEKNKPSRFSKPREYNKEIEMSRKTNFLTLVDIPLPLIKEEESKSRQESSISERVVMVPYDGQSENENYYGTHNIDYVGTQSMAQGGAQSMTYGHNKRLDHRETQESTAFNKRQSLTHSGGQSMAYKGHNQRIVPSQGLGFEKGGSSNHIQQMKPVQKRVHNQLDLNSENNKDITDDDPFFYEHMTMKKNPRAMMKQKRTAHMREATSGIGSGFQTRKMASQFLTSDILPPLPYQSEQDFASSPKTWCQFGEEPKEPARVSLEQTRAMRHDSSQKTPNYNICATKNAASQLRLSNGRLGQQRPIIKTKQNDEELDDILKEIDLCYYQVTKEETKTQFAQSGPKRLTRDKNYLNKSQDLDDFIAEIDGYLRSDKI